MTILIDRFDSQPEREYFARFSKTISNNALIIVGMQLDRDCNAMARPGSGDRGTCLAWLISGCSRAAAEQALQAMALVASGQDDEYVLGQDAVWGTITKTDVTVETEFDDMDAQHYTHEEIGAALMDWVQIWSMCRSRRRESPWQLVRRDSGSLRTCRIALSQTCWSAALKVGRAWGFQ